MSYIGRERGVSMGPKQGYNQERKRGGLRKEVVQHQRPACSSKVYTAETSSPGA